MSDLIQALIGAAEKPQEPSMSRGEAARMLVAGYARLQRAHIFKEGDLIQWKPGLCHKKQNVNVLVVTRVLGTPVRDVEHNSGSPYFRESLDLVALEVAAGDSLCEFYLDSRRMEPYTGETAPSH